MENFNSEVLIKLTNIIESQGRIESKVNDINSRMETIERRVYVDDDEKFKGLITGQNQILKKMGFYNRLGVARMIVGIIVGILIFWFIHNYWIDHEKIINNQEIRNMLK